VFIEKLKEEKNVNALCISLSGLRTEPVRAKAVEVYNRCGPCVSGSGRSVYERNNT